MPINDQTGVRGPLTMSRSIFDRSNIVGRYNFSDEESNNESDTMSFMKTDTKTIEQSKRESINKFKFINKD